MRFFIVLFVFFSGGLIFAQDFTNNEEKPKVKVDSLYREDQFYFGITYNNLVSSPEGFSKDKISSGFTSGFLRDMPVNKNRTYAIALGLGFTYNKYRNNFGVSGTNQQPNYAILVDGTYNANRLSTFTIDMPLELRWRSSTFESTKFWRIYTGFKLSYLVNDRYVYRAPLADITVKNNKDLNKLGYGIYVASGYNTFNVYIHYGLNSLFKSGQVGSEKVQLRSFNLGLLFYIL
jgi:hypothetical protein